MESVSSKNATQVKLLARMAHGLRECPKSSILESSFREAAYQRKLENYQKRDSCGVEN